MKTKPYQKLTALAAAFTLALAGTTFAEEKKDHADHKEHADHKDGDEAKKIAGPNGGRVLTGVEPHLEFFVTKDRKVKITAVDDAGKAAPLGEQSVTVTGGSRTTYATGIAVIEASKGVIEILRGRAAKMWECDAADVEWGEGEAICTAGENKGKTFSLGEIAAKAGATGGPIAFENGVNPLQHLPGYGAHICDVEVDKETGNVSVVRYTVVQDVGKAIHPAYVEGQMQGGAVQGIGWALNEAYIYNKDGRLDNAGFLDYRIPVASDMPMIDTVMVEKANPGHPYGVKGVGEVPIVPPLAAVGSAVSKAVGKPMRSLPISPDKVHAALNGG